MKKIVKTILLGCLVVLPLFALSACSSRSHFATQKDQWQTYTKEKKIKIGFDATFVPMGFEEKDGSYVGFDIDLATAVQSRMSVSSLQTLQSLIWSMNKCW